MSIILIEGLDGTGKTTLAHDMLDRGSDPEAWWERHIYFKTTKIPKYAHNDWIDDFVVARTIAHTHLTSYAARLICDRCVLSGIAYAKPSFEMEEAQHLFLSWMGYLVGQEVALIHLIAPRGTRRLRDYEGVKNDPRFDFDGFVEWAGTHHNVKYFQYDTSLATTREIVEDLRANRPF